MSTNCRFMERFSPSRRLADAIVTRDEFEVQNLCASRIIDLNEVNDHLKAQPLIFAILHSSPEVVRVLILHGADVNSRSPVSLYKHEPYDPKKHEKIPKSMIEEVTHPKTGEKKKIVISTAIKHGFNAGLAAIMSRNKIMFDLVNDVKVDFTNKDDFGNTILHYCFHSFRGLPKTLLEILKEQNFDFNSVNQANFSIYDALCDFIMFSTNEKNFNTECQSGLYTIFTLCKPYFDFSKPISYSKKTGNSKYFRPETIAGHLWYLASHPDDVSEKPVLDPEFMFLLYKLGVKMSKNDSQFLAKNVLLSPHTPLIRAWLATVGTLPAEINGIPTATYLEKINRKRVAALCSLFLLDRNRAAKKKLLEKDGEGVSTLDKNTLYTFATDFLSTIGQSVETLEPPSDRIVDKLREQIEDTESHLTHMYKEFDLDPKRDPYYDIPYVKYIIELDQKIAQFEPKLKEDIEKLDMEEKLKKISNCPYHSRIVKEMFALTEKPKSMEMVPPEVHLLLTKMIDLKQELYPDTPLAEFSTFQYEQIIKSLITENDIFQYISQRAMTLEMHEKTNSHISKLTAMGKLSKAMDLLKERNPELDFENMRVKKVSRETAEKFKDHKQVINLSTFESEFKQPPAPSSPLHHTAPHARTHNQIGKALYNIDDFAEGYDDVIDPNYADHLQDFEDAKYSLESEYYGQVLNDESSKRIAAMGITDRRNRNFSTYTRPLPSLSSSTFKYSLTSLHNRSTQMKLGPIYLTKATATKYAKNTLSLIKKL